MLDAMEKLRETILQHTREISSYHQARVVMYR